MNALFQEIRASLQDLRERFVAWADDVDRRSKAGLFGTWPWQAKPDTRHIFFDACCTDEAARQIARVAIAESGAAFAVVHYQDVDGTRKTLVEAA
jgi:hypothetical protein